MIIKAGDLTVGSQVAEADGFLFDVTEIVKETEKTITVRLCSDFSSIPSHWRFKKDGTPGGVLKTFKNQQSFTGCLHRTIICRKPRMTKFQMMYRSRRIIQ